MAEYYRASYSLRQIGKLFSVSGARVQRILDEMREPRRRRGRYAE